MAEFEENIKSEKEVLNFFRNLIKQDPQQFKESMQATDFIQRARVLAFLQVRDSEVYKKAQEILNEVCNE
jgi:hypothetical protein